MRNVQKYYFIEQRIFYYPDIHLLCDSEHNTVSLPIPASLCFQQLIKQQGKLITHEDLLNLVWTARGMRVTTNTLYQNISLLRKALNRAGLEGGVIKTYSKRGVLLWEGLQISLLTEQMPLTITEPQTPTVLPLSYLSDNFSGAKCISVSKLWLLFRSVINLGRWFKHRKRFVLLLSLITLLSGLQSCYIFVKSASPRVMKQNDFTQYFRIGQLQQCQFFLSPALGDPNAYQPIIGQFSQQCDKQRWVYISRVPDSDFTSILSCHQPLSSGLESQLSQCDSRFYLTTSLKD